MGKKINQLRVATNEEVVNKNWLMAVANPVTGEALQMTIEQARKTFTPQIYVYTASGAEGTTIHVDELVDKNIMLMTREGQEVYEVGDTPASNEFSWDGVDFTLGTVTNAGERIKIIYTHA